jgi:hypothetical protein
MRKRLKDLRDKERGIDRGEAEEKRETRGHLMSTDVGGSYHEPIDSREYDRLKDFYQRMDVVLKIQGVTLEQLETQVADKVAVADKAQRDKEAKEAQAAHNAIIAKEAQVNKDRDAHNAEVLKAQGQRPGTAPTNPTKP